MKPCGYESHVVHVVNVVHAVHVLNVVHDGLVHSCRKSETYTRTYIQTFGLQGLLSHVAAKNYFLVETNNRPFYLIVRQTNWKLCPNYLSLV